MSIINLGKLSQIINDIETIFSQEGLNIEEKLLVVQKINNRLQTMIQKNRSSDMIREMPFMDLLKKVQKDREEE